MLEGEISAVCDRVGDELVRLSQRIYDLEDTLSEAIHLALDKSDEAKADLSFINYSKLQELDRTRQAIQDLATIMKKISSTDAQSSDFAKLMEELSLRDLGLRVLFGAAPLPETADTEDQDMNGRISFF